MRSIQKVPQQRGEAPARHPDNRPLSQSVGPEVKW